MKKETLHSIAQRAGVSVTTVSRVLNDSARKYRISKMTEQKVLQLAKQCAYAPKSLAKSMKESKSSIIGLVVPSLAEPFFASIASLIIRSNAGQGYTTIIVDIQNNLSKEKSEIRNLLSRNIDGMIIVPSSDCSYYLESVDKLLPVIQIDRHLESTALSSVCCNNFHIGKTLTELLLNNGHRSIACLCGTPSVSSTAERVKGYEEAMQSLGLNPLVYGGTFDPQECFVTTKELLCSDKRPTAIVTLSNYQVLGVLKAVRSLGMTIPDDLSLVTVDDNLYMRYLSISVTRMYQPMEDMVRTCCDMLYRRLNGTAQSGASSVLLMPDLLEGDSVKRLQ